MWTAQAPGLRAVPSGGVGWAPPAAPGTDTPRQTPCPAPSTPCAGNKLEEKEEAALLSWETYLKENYLQSLQSQQRQRPEHRIQHISDRCRGPGGRLGRALRPGGSEALCGHGPPRDGPATGALAPETPAVPRRGLRPPSGPRPSLRVLGGPPVLQAGWPRRRHGAGWPACWGTEGGPAGGHPGAGRVDGEQGRQPRRGSCRAPSARPSPPSLPPFRGEVGAGGSPLHPSPQPDGLQKGLAASGTHAGGSVSLSVRVAR